MRWTSWPLRSPQRRLCVLGLDVGPEACRLVLLSGTTAQPELVCCIENWHAPQGGVVNGEVMQLEPLDRWLRTTLEATETPPNLAYIALDSTCVTQHLVTLVAGLSPADVVFQLLAEVESVLPETAAGVCIDYTVDTNVTSVGEQRYQVCAASRQRVAALQGVLQHAGLKVAGIEPCTQAARRTERCHVWVDALENRTALTPESDTALGLALRAWCDEGFNFLPHRKNAAHLLRRKWLREVAVCVLAGACLAAIMAWAMAVAAQAKRHQLGDVAATQRAWDEAQQAHAQAKAQETLRAEQTRWLQSRQGLQSQSWQWSRVLSDAAQGTWVTSVKQKDTHWTVQGEALSSKHAQQLVQQLKALPIWAQAPELSHLQTMPSVSTTGLPVWQFRIEASLKEGV